MSESSDLRDIPLDVLEIIYNNLDVKDASSLNIAINKQIYKSRVSRIRHNIRLIPKKFHRNIIPITSINQTNIDDGLCDYFYGIYTDRNVNDLTRLTNLKFLGLSSNHIQDISFMNNLKELILYYVTTPLNLNSFINLTKLNCSNSIIQDVSNLVNLIELDCQNTPILDVSKLTKLKSLKCNNTNIKDVRMLTSLETLICSETSISDIDNLINLKRLVFSGSFIKSIDHLINLTYLSCTSCNNIKSIRGFKYLEYMFVNLSFILIIKQPFC